MENYFETNEKQDFKKLIEFNSKTHLFDGIEETPEKHHTDATAYTSTKLGEIRRFNIELKNRNLNLLNDGRLSGTTSNGSFYCDTIWIEDHKIADMLLDYIDGLEGLYINFLNDGKTLIFNLHKLSKRPLKSKEMNIKSRGYGKFEMAKRQGLYIVDAAIFDENGKLIKKQGEEYDKSRES